MHWMDLLLAFFAIVVGGAEVYAIKNHTPGDTITERTRHYFNTKKDATTKVGAYAFLALLGTFFAWFAAHIVQVPV